MLLNGKRKLMSTYRQTWLEIKKNEQTFECAKYVSDEKVEFNIAFSG